MEEIFNRLIKEDLSPNTYYVLHCIKEKIVPNQFVNAALESNRLQKDNWITEDLQLTAKSHIFMEEINGFFRKSKKKTSRDLMGDEFSQKILEYVNIFPNKKLNYFIWKIEEILPRLCCQSLASPIYLKHLKSLN